MGLVDIRRSVECMHGGFSLDSKGILGGISSGGKS